MIAIILGIAAIVAGVRLIGYGKNSFKK